MTPTVSFGTTRNSDSSIFYKKLSSITSFDKSRINIVKLDLEDKNLLQKYCLTSINLYFQSKFCL